MLRYFKALLVLTVTLAVSQAAPRPKEAVREGPYFPTTKGTKGVFDLGQSEMAWEVVSVEEKGGETIVSISADMQGKKGPYQKVAVSAKGLSQLEVLDFKVEPYSLLRFPVKAGDSWGYNIAEQPGLRNETGTMTVGPVEDVETPAGKFKAVRVEISISVVNGAQQAKPLQSTCWYDSEIGLVKWNSAQGFSGVLKLLTRPGKKD